MELDDEHKGLLRRQAEATELMAKMAIRNMTEPHLQDYNRYKETIKGPTHKRSDVLAMLKSQAQRGFLSPEEVLLMQYTVCGTEDDLMFFVSEMLPLSGAQRIKLHNWRVADMQGESFVYQHGAKIHKLKWPLFPDTDPEFKALNDQLLRHQALVPEGGGQWCTLYRKPSGGPDGGAVYMPHENGQTDVTQIADAFQAMKEQMEQVQQRLQQLGQDMMAVRKELERSQNELRHAHYQLQNQQRQQHYGPPQYNPPPQEYAPPQQYANHGGARGNWRGGGRGGGGRGGYQQRQQGNQHRHQPRYGAYGGGDHLGLPT